MQRKLHIFFDDDLPDMATHESQHKCGYSIYRGVLVQWDEDRDTRVMDLIDAMASGIRDKLLIIQEHEGSVAFLWKDYVPEGYQENGGVETPDGDYWSICSSDYLDADEVTSEFTNRPEKSKEAQ